MQFPETPFHVVGQAEGQRLEVADDLVHVLDDAGDGLVLMFFVSISVLAKSVVNDGYQTLTNRVKRTIGGATENSLVSSQFGPCNLVRDHGQTTVISALAIGLVFVEFR